MLIYDSDTADEHQELLSMINCILGGKDFSIDLGIARIKKFLIMRAIERHGGDVAMAKKSLGLTGSTNHRANKKGAGRRTAPRRKPAQQHQRPDPADRLEQTNHPEVYGRLALSAKKAR